MDKLIVTIGGVLGMLLIYWFFLGKKDEVHAVTDEVDILVEGGYTPQTISIPKDQTVTINFFRKDPSSCLEEVVIPEFKIKKYLPLNQKVTIKITAKKTGEFGFVCGMNMYHGKILVI